MRFSGHVGVKHGVEEGEENPGRHLVHLDAVARIQEEQRDDDGAEGKSINGAVATAARTQRMLSRSKRREASRNLRISKSSIPKAFTTRLPVTVSCKIWLSSPRRLWLRSDECRIFLPICRPEVRPTKHDAYGQGHPPIDVEHHG